ncbi:hypothetical protein BGZ89_010259 [Linnemannia elongata]|nr:hypothetical protein BGZ91_012225 [Linnemannia elongata]KAG0069231.1 hypothetical protein BGZ90_000283 [Linnemannia elongata]KAG0071548.1 hypothetical protein BGZ89_010259 [Linnemannia elongata]
MNFDADRLAMPEEEDLDLDISAETGPNQQLDSMLQLEQALEEETRDISTRFQSERRPQPAGLDRALGDDRTNSRSGGRGTNENYAQHKYASKNGGFVTGFDPLSREEQAKKANRAQRFGGLPQEPSETKDEAMEEAGMEVDDNDFARPDNLPETPPRTSSIRLDAVHLYGTDEMSTKDVLKYFDAYGPSHVEWIDDSSCNIVFPDQFSAKRAVYFQLLDKENVTFGEDGDDADIEPSREISESGIAEPIVVPKSKNRLQRAKEYVPIQQHNQLTTAKSNSGLFVRYATDFDRKERNAAAKSVYYAIHGREDATSTGQRSSTTSSRYGRRSRADEDEVWNRGRGIQTMSRLRRRMEGASPSPSPTRRSWSRGRRLSGSRSRSGSRSGSYSRSRSPRRSARRDHGSRSPDARDRRSDDYDNRGRRGDISLRLGGRVKFPEEESAIADSRMNQYADEFLAELESTFTRREKAIPRTKMYSDFYERETLTEKSRDSDRRGGGRHRDRDNRGDGGNDRGGRRRGGNNRRDNNTASFAGAAKTGPSGGRDRNDDHRSSREEAMKAMDARLGLPADLDEFGRSQRD